MHIIILTFLLLSISFTYGQHSPILKPILGEENTFSKPESEYWRSAIDSLTLSDNYENETNYSEMYERTKKAIDSLETFFGSLTQTVACS
jgi:hypothetical protein